MNLHDLRQAQASFSVDDAIESRKQLIRLRIAFVKNFSLKHIAEMKIDEYVIGKGNETFCYRIERELDGLGRILGATAIKFGVYYGVAKGEDEYKYRHSEKIWGSNHKIAFQNIRKALEELIVAGKNGDIETIVNSKISTMFKGKILSTYYPERYLNIFSNDHLNYYLQFYGLLNDENLIADPVLKREALMAYKNSDKVMKHWDADIFANFLYSAYPKSPVKEQPESEILTDYKAPVFPISQTPETIELNILPIQENAKSGSHKKSGNKTDYEKENRLLKQLGDMGEDLVVKYESKRLELLGLTKKAKKVERVSLKSDAFGYDILSFNDDESERYIEVKATRAKAGTANFFLTLNELNTAKEKKVNYYIYMVYDILSTNPQIWIIPNPFSPENKDVFMEPVNYRVKINAKK
jgi:hypothetical protein